jgi:signal transduction histidine kinase
VRLLPTSLFGRMFALSLLATLAALALAGVAIGGVLERFVTRGVDARLGDRLIALESAVRPDGTLDRAQLARVTGAIPHVEPWRIDTPEAGGGAGGDIVEDDHLRDRPGPDRPAPPPPQPGNARPFEGRSGDGRHLHGLAGTVPTKAGDVLVRVAVPRAEIDRPVLAALAPLAVSLAILGLALGGAALIQLRLGLRPLGRLREAVEAIRHGRANRVSEAVPDELVPLARALNALAADTAAALEGARASAANLAHALKTPVATLSLHLTDDPVAQAHLARIDATLRHHLGRARAAATDRRAATRLAPALSDLAATIAALHHDRIHITVAVPDGLAAAVDPQDLDEIAGNLIDNAARHAVARARIVASAADRHILLTVADDGPGIPAADRARATAPGTRLDERSDGHGFGLSIARELVELYGGTLALGDAEGGGPIASITLPYAR